MSDRSIYERDIKKKFLLAHLEFLFKIQRPICIKKKHKLFGRTIKAFENISLVSILVILFNSNNTVKKFCAVTVAVPSLLFRTPSPLYP